MADARGLEVYLVTVVPDEGLGSLGRVRYAFEAASTPAAEAALTDAAICLSGLIAETIAFGSGGGPGAEKDRERLDQLLEGMPRRASLRLRAEGYCVALTILSRHWPAVLALAHALEELAGR